MTLRLPPRPSPQSMWVVFPERLMLWAREPQQTIDIIERMFCCTRHSGIGDSSVAVRSMHAMAAILTNENELLLRDDLGWVLADRALVDARCSRDDYGRRAANMAPEERPGGHAHAGAMALALRSRITCSC